MIGEKLFKHKIARWGKAYRLLKESFNEIEAAIKTSEETHSGEICFIVEAGLASKQIVAKRSARQRAEELFASHRIWDTERNNGVLLYLLLADRNIEIVADRGICQFVSPDQWERICLIVEDHCRAGHFKAGVISGIREVGASLTQHYPRSVAKINEVSDRPVKV